MSTGQGRTPQEREALHEAKILGVVRSRLQEARRSRATGSLIIDIRLFKGGPAEVYTEVGVTYRVLED